MSIEEEACKFSAASLSFFCLSPFRTYFLMIPLPTHNENETATVGDLTVVIGPLLVSHMVPNTATILGPQTQRTSVQSP